MYIKYTSTTNMIEVTITPSFIDNYSLPTEDCYLWAYNVQIKNMRPSTVQLLTHKWRIIGSSGIINEVSGLGVVGQQPIMRSGEVFQYTSGTYLDVPTAVMQGEYELIDESDMKLLTANIPTFSLDSPYSNALLN